jgi:hypothetical protein
MVLRDIHIGILANLQGRHSRWFQAHRLEFFDSASPSLLSSKTEDDVSFAHASSLAEREMQAL